MKERITRTGQGAVVEGDRTDWDRLRAMTDEQVEATIADDPDWTPFEDIAMREAVVDDGMGQWHWLLIGRDGREIARSPGDFADRAAAMDALAAFRQAMVDEMRRAA